MIGLRSRLRRHERPSGERWGGMHPQSPILLLGTICKQDFFYSSSATRMRKHESYTTHQCYQLMKTPAQSPELGLIKIMPQPVFKIKGSSHTKTWTDNPEEGRPLNE